MKNNDNPFLQGNFAPWRSEDHYDYLEVEGKIPEDINGTLIRNGSNPQFDPTGFYHWFDGDGMLHAIRFNKGQASYSNRWIRTERFKLEQEAGCAIFCAENPPKGYLERAKQTPPNTANTNIVAYNRTLLALNEGGLPYSIQRSNLATIGEYTFNGQIKRRLSAHPRYDHLKRELMTYSYINEDESLRYFRLNGKNQLIVEKQIDWPYPVMLHDFINTENYVIFPLFPCTMSLARMQRGESIFMWEGDQLPTWFIITDRNGNEVARVETDPCHAYHFGNAFEQGKSIIIDAMVGSATGLMPDRNGKIATRKECNTRYARWAIDLSTKKVTLSYLDERSTEFPRFDERFNGLPYNTLYAGGRNKPEDLFDRLISYQAGTDQKEELLFGEDIPSEPVFVAKSKKEGDGYLLATVYRSKEDRSDVVILDASRISEGPIATIKIPHRIPFGFHGNFV